MADANLKEVFPRLTQEQNFSNWKFRVRLILEEKQVWSVIENGKSEIKNEDFVKMDAKAKNIIVQCISDKYLEIVKKCNTAKEMMNQLEYTFERKSIFNKLHLKRKLITLRCSTNEKLQDYFMKFDSLLGELDAAGCTVEEMDKVCYLLSSMPALYDNVITSIETMTTEKSINIEFVKARLLDAEVKGQGCEQEKQAQTSFLTCFNCRKPGHKAYECKSERGHNRGRQANFRGNMRGRGQSMDTRYYRGRSQGQGRGQDIEQTMDTRNYRGRSHGRGRGQERGALSEVNLMTFVASENLLSADVYNKNIKFIIDSGASQNLVMDNYEQYMTNIQNLKTETKIYVANGQYLMANRKGNLNVVFDNIPITVEALIVKNLSHNLLSVKRLLDNGNSVTFHKTSVSIRRGNAIIYGELYGSLYAINLKLNSEKCCSVINDNDLWHKRLGHANRKHLGLLQLPSSEKPCGPCMEGKSTRLPFVTTARPRSRYVGELLHTDLSGPVAIPTIEGELYYQTIIDDYTHFTEVYLLKRKSEAADILMEYVNRQERQTGNKVRKIRSDNGGEFKNEKLYQFCKSKGIIQQYTTPYSPQSNGVAERMNRNIYNRARTLLLETGLPKTLWGEAVKCAVYQINRCPSFAIDYYTPAEKMFGHTDLKRLRIFGSKAWVHILPKQDKLLQRAKEMRFIGYSPNGYRLWNPENNEIVVSRDVRIDETDIKYKEKTEKEENDKRVMERYYEEEKMEKEDTEKIEEDDQKTGECYENTKQGRKRDEISKEGTKKYQEDDEKNTEIDQESENEEDKPEKHKYTTRSGREIRKPKDLEEYDLNIAYCLCAGEPVNYEEAIKDKDWKQAIKRELDSHNKLGTWEISELPEGSKAIETKWIFKQKQDGTKKARLVAKGFQQEVQEGYYSPVARLPTIRTMLSHAVQEKLVIKQLDVPTAFLNGDLENDVYIKCPKGVNHQGKVLKLKKALYGLKEAPKCWNQKFHKFITSNGFIQSKHDFCLYKNEDTWLLIFVDDILLLGNERILKKLKEEFKIKDLGEVKNYLGLEITRNNNQMEIKQTDMITRILDKFNMPECKGINTPMETNFSAEKEEIIDVPYKELIGCLLFISMNTRPDITYPVAYLSRFLDKPTASLWRASKRILRYLKATQEKGLIYKKIEKEKNLVAYADADWAADKTDRKSTSGCAVFYCGNLIHWFSKKQTAVALSTAEAEYVAASQAISELIYLKGILYDLTSLLDMPTTLLVDNQSAIRLIKNFDNGKRSKHIDIKVHYIKDIVQKQLVSVDYIPTDENVSDLFTKALPKIKHNYFVSKLNLL